MNIHFYTLLVIPTLLLEQGFTLTQNERTPKGDIVIRDFSMKESEATECLSGTLQLFTELCEWMGGSPLELHLSEKEIKNGRAMHLALFCKTADDWQTRIEDLIKEGIIQQFQKKPAAKYKELYDAIEGPHYEFVRSNVMGFLQSHDPNRQHLYIRTSDAEKFAYEDITFPYEVRPIPLSTMAKLLRSVQIYDLMGFLQVHEYLSQDVGLSLKKKVPEAVLGENSIALIRFEKLNKNLIPMVDRLFKIIKPDSEVAHRFTTILNDGITLWQKTIFAFIA